jgi:TolB-like protein/DNA-binding winged helix-turn-helix (wHTH) protein/Tfp pilus assembly protein PilF
MGEVASSPDNGVYQLLDLEVDLARRTVARDAEAIVLPELSFRLLAALIRCAPETINKDELVREVWDEVIVSDETLSQRVRLLRQALGEDGQDPRYVSSVRGRGYRLICPVTPIATNKNVGSPHKHWPIVLAAMLALVVAVLWPIVTDKEETRPGPAIQSIAVLPFADLSPNQDHGYFADGMQEELLTRLAKLKNLQVASRTTVEQYRSTALSLPDIAAQLGVGAVIESSIRIADNRVRITVQLIDAQSDRHLWAEVYDRELSVENIFSIQQEVAEQIAQALALEYQVSQAPASVLLPTTSIDAYNVYLVGRYHTFAQTPEDLALAIKFLQQAVAIDPEFAEAWAMLGWAYSFVGTLYGEQPPREVYPKAKEAVTRALSIDHELADARTLYADILAWYDWDFAAAEREYLKALALDPNNVLGYVLFLSTQLRHEEAIALIEQRIEANPDDAYAHINAAWTFMRNRQYERAMQEANLAQEHTDARPVLGFAYLGLGEVEQAVDVFETNLQVEGRRPRQLANLAIAYFAAGRESEAQQLLDQLTSAAATQYVSPDLFADVYFAAGDIDKGFAALEQVVEVRSRGAIFLQTNTSLDDHRQDPRYLALIEAVGFQ